jgi:spore coat polysaccharide biosynthesis protein SpsF (cytidylyltransferase family)
MIVAIIQARLGSKRLPNKVLMEVVPGISMLEMVVRKVQLARTVDKVVVTSPDNKLCELATLFGVDSWDYRGPRDLIREIDQAVWAWSLMWSLMWSLIEQKETQEDVTIDAIVRITADCPLVRPEIIDKCVNIYLDGGYDLVYNSFEDTGADGSDIECFSMNALERAHKESKEREHPTIWMRENLKTRYVETPFEGCSVDIQEDLDRVRKIFREGEWT